MLITLPTDQLNRLCPRAVRRSANQLAANRIRLSFEPEVAVELEGKVQVYSSGVSSYRVFLGAFSSVFV